MKTLTSKIAIKSNLNNIEEVMNWIKSDLKPLFKIQAKFESLKLSIQEAVTNAIIHGNHSDENKYVGISYKISDELNITIEDEGDGIVLENQLQDVTDIKEKDIFKESGRGIMLMKHFCDDIIFTSNSVTLVIKYK